jgi:hypothetical protein
MTTLVAVTPAANFRKLRRSETIVATGNPDFDEIVFITELL